jgi:ABC-type Mn2+/Zn2+ transport system permease subunit
MSCHQGFRQALVLAMAAAVLAVVAGLMLAYALSLAAGGVIMLTALSILVGTTLASRVSRWARSHS